MLQKFLQACTLHKTNLFQIYSTRVADFNSDGSDFDEFLIDRTIGRDVVIQMDHSSDAQNNIDTVNVRHPNGTVDEHDFEYDGELLVFRFSYPMLEVGCFSSRL